MRWKNFSSFGCEAVALCVGQPNVLKCAVGCLFTMRLNGGKIGDGADF
ncbi:MAG: hypothetical protein IT215_05915 [Chitinophagaceae bacterium]|nr:hypothetical protein [Chitinophagaceae bacterium]